MPSNPTSSAKRARPATSLHGIRCWAMSNPNLTWTPSAESRLRSFLALTVDEHVDALVEERNVPGDALAFRPPCAARPHDVLFQPLADTGRPVLRLPLVRTVARLVGVDEQIHAHVDLREVPPGREAGLEQHECPGRVGEHDALHLDAHGA